MNLREANMDYDNLTDDEILDKMAEIDYDIWTTEQQLRNLKDTYNQALQIAHREEQFFAVRAAHRNKPTRPSFR